MSQGPRLRRLLEAGQPLRRWALHAGGRYVPKQPGSIVKRIAPLLLALAGLLAILTVGLSVAAAPTGALVAPAEDDAFGLGLFSCDSPAYVYDSTVDVAQVPTAEPDGVVGSVVDLAGPILRLSSPIGHAYDLSLSLVAPQAGQSVVSMTFSERATTSSYWVDKRILRSLRIGLGMWFSIHRTGRSS